LNMTLESGSFTTFAASPVVFRSKSSQRRVRLRQGYGETRGGGQAFTTETQRARSVDRGKSQGLGEGLFGDVGSEI
jgi:hypothetical protein